jgi:hypothetical protein
MKSSKVGTSTPQVRSEAGVNVVRVGRFTSSGAARS